MPNAYLASAIPQHELAELHRLMNEEIREVAVFFMDPNGIITVWNRSAEELKGYTAQEAIGQHLRLLYTEEDRARRWAEHNLDEAKAHGFYSEETWLRRKDGTLFWARISLTALTDHSGKLLGYSKVSVDLTAHKMLEECAKENDQIKRILSAANAGTWIWRPHTDEIEVSPNLLAMLGGPGAATRMTLGEWMHFVHPEDRPLVAERFHRTRSNLPDERLVMEMRMCPSQDTCRFFYVQADWSRETDDGPYELSGVNVDVQELRTAEQELRQAVERLKEADARKDEFLAMLAHELRNPLAPIRTAAEILRLAELDEERVRHTSEVIARQAEHMTNLVDDLLDVSRVTRGLVDLDRKPLDVRQIVTDAVEQVNPIVRARHHHLTLHLSPHATVVLGDQKRLVQVVANLLNNAAKFTPEGGNIQLKTEVEDGKVVLTVVDDGAGMEPELARKVFELFTQAERTPDRSSGGLGLGLALVKSLVELQGGTVKCSSQGLGKGSTFTVCLPLAPVTSLQVDPERGSRRLQEADRPLRVMVVDDNADAANMLAMLLEASGHEVTAVHRPREALARSRDLKPDVCLLDIGLPEIDGNELARRMKARAETAGSVLIAVTGYGQRHDRETALAAGFDHHLVKPVDPAELESLLAAISLRASSGSAASASRPPG